MSDINEMNEGLRWYVAHTYSGYENKVKTNLEKIIENRGLGDLITDIRIPTEVVVESDGGKEREVESKIFPAYVLVKMVMTVCHDFTQAREVHYLTERFPVKIFKEVPIE